MGLEAPALAKVLTAKIPDAFDPQLRQARGVHSECHGDVRRRAALAAQIRNRLSACQLSLGLDTHMHILTGEKRGINNIGHSGHIVVADIVWMTQEAPLPVAGLEARGERL